MLGNNQKLLETLYNESVVFGSTDKIMSENYIHIVASAPNAQRNPFSFTWILPNIHSIEARNREQIAAGHSSGL